MGQPDLIYKFMDLANYQASLNSKRGAAFGFSKIAKQAGDALQPHLRSLIPRLVRYQYDPDKNVQVIECLYLNCIYFKYVIRSTKFLLVLWFVGLECADNVIIIFDSCWRYVSYACNINACACNM